jgi:hypothetical protein
LILQIEISNLFVIQDVIHIFSLLYFSPFIEIIGNVICSAFKKFNFSRPNNFCCAMKVLKNPVKLILQVQISDLFVIYKYVCIQSVPGAKVNILGDHGIGHSKKKMFT